MIGLFGNPGEEGEWFECGTCCYGTNSSQRMDDHEDEHIRAARPDPWKDIPAEYKEFFYDSTLED